MAYFAQVKSNIVRNVIVADQEFINEGSVGDPDYWVETSYDNNFRKQYAGNGFIYDAENDVFVRPQPFPSWALDSNYDWQSPTPYPDDGKNYAWNETTKVWDAQEE